MEKENINNESNENKEICPGAAEPVRVNAVDEKGVAVKATRPFGIGCDIHRDTAVVCLIVRQGASLVEFCREFGTDRKSLLSAKEWIRALLVEKSDPAVELNEDNFIWVIESTSMYHIPVISAWGGKPCVVNPKIARTGTRKSDKLDASMPGLQCLLGTWEASYVPSDRIQVLRMMLAERDSFKKTATRIGNRINSNTLRFGDTSGREGSVVKNENVRRHLEAIVGGEEDDTGIDSAGIPREAWDMFTLEYGEYDRYSELADEYEMVLVQTIKEMDWETAEGTLGGEEMMRLLTTVPGVGEYTAAVWLVRVVTPRRFSSPKALVAYAGFDPSVKVSAGEVTSTEKRKGDALLHSRFSMAASNLLNRRSEPYGEWGYRIKATTGKRAKAVSAIARRLVTAMYWVQMKGQPFSYEGYRFAKEPEVIDMTIEELCEVNTAFRRYIRPLHAAGITNATQMVHEYHVCRLQNVKGLGQKFFILVKEFIGNQKPYKEYMEDK